MAKTGADPDRRESFDFYQLLRAVESRIITIENAKRMGVLLEDPLNIQLIQELQQQRNELSRRREGRLLEPVRSGVQEGAQIPPVSIDQEAAAQGPTQGYSSVPGYEDWQSSTRYPQDCQPPQDS